MKKHATLSLGLGVFDGLHRGHHLFLDKTNALLTFSPHPDIVLQKNTDLRILTTVEELRHLSRTHVHRIPFTRAMTQWDPYFFLDHCILTILRPQKLVVGYDFRFGVNQSGTLDTLATWTKNNGIDLEILPAYPNDAHPIKSSAIRNALKNRDLDKAVEWLGHPYLMIGRIQKGDGRGRELGFPTANLLCPPRKLIPSTGVYGGWASVGQALPTPAMMYVGKAPTFLGKTQRVEIHLLEKKGHWYNQKMKVWFGTAIREERLFDSIPDLVRQLHRDKQAVLSWIQEHPGFLPRKNSL